jgi:hypothetical protein
LVGWWAEGNGSGGSLGWLGAAEEGGGLAEVGGIADSSVIEEVKVVDVVHLGLVVVERSTGVVPLQLLVMTSVSTSTVMAVVGMSNTILESTTLRKRP